MEQEKKGVMEERRGALVLFALFLVAGNLASFFVEYGFSFTGNVVGDFTRDISAFRFQAFAFLVQWGVIFGMLALASRKQHLEEPKVMKVSKVEQVQTLKRAFTDLDVLYATLQKKGRIKMSMIAATFKIDKEKALEWSKILEGHDLALIQYKAFGEPELILKDEKK